MRLKNSIMMGLAVLIGEIIAYPALFLQPAVFGFLTAFTLTGASMAINDYFDRYVDAVNEPERPLPKGLVSPSSAMSFGAFLSVLGLASALVLGVALLYFWVMGTSFLSIVSRSIRTGLLSASSPGEFTLSTVQALFKDTISLFARATLPFMLCIVVIVALANVLQGGFVLTAEPLKPKLTRLNPINGLKRVFGSFRAIAETATSSMKLIVVALIGYLTIGPEL